LPLHFREAVLEPGPKLGNVTKQRPDGHPIGDGERRDEDGTREDDDCGRHHQVSIFFGVRFSVAYLEPAATLIPLQEHPGEVQVPLFMDDE
jgi:hypothetical protein